MNAELPFQISMEDAPPAEDVQAVHKGLEAYNQRIAPSSAYQPLTIMLRRPDGTVAGGLLGGSYWGWLHVDILWLDEAARGQGLGTRLLTLAEDEGRRRGCQQIYLDTMSFQALPFYLKHGYEVWGELPDFPVGHARHFLKKRL